MQNDTFKGTGVGQMSCRLRANRTFSAEVACWQVGHRQCERAAVAAGPREAGSIWDWGSIVGKGSSSSENHRSKGPANRRRLLNRLRGKVVGRSKNRPMREIGRQKAGKVGAVRQIRHLPRPVAKPRDDSLKNLIEQAVEQHDHCLEQLAATQPVAVRCELSIPATCGSRSLPAFGVSYVIMLFGGSFHRIKSSAQEPRCAFI